MKEDIPEIVGAALANTSQKCRKSAQNTPGNHISTQTPSTTYGEFYAKTPPPPPFSPKFEVFALQRL